MTTLSRSLRPIHSPLESHLHEILYREVELIGTRMVHSAAIVCFQIVPVICAAGSAVSSTASLATTKLFSPTTAFIIAGLGRTPPLSVRRGIVYRHELLTGFLLHLPECISRALSRD
jgi:hypothetical protein